MASCCFYHQLRRAAGGGGVCLIKRCLKINIRRIYLFCDEGEGEQEEVGGGGFEIVGGVVSAEVLR